MQVVIIASAEQKDEWLSSLTTGNSEAVWIGEIEALQEHPGADLVVDLLFENTVARKQILLAEKQAIIVVNSVPDTLNETNKEWVRIGAWHGFLSASIEAACSDLKKRESVAQAFGRLGKTITWVPDQPGFITPRVISMIINEAWMALAEGVSSREEIDTAMKLGTAYPYGPFEWSNKIGLQNIATLLEKLSVAQPRYTPAALLLQETNKGI